jgi:hypothetical protein
LSSDIGEKDAEIEKMLLFTKIDSCFCGKRGKESK